MDQYVADLARDLQMECEANGQCPELPKILIYEGWGLYFYKTMDEGSRFKLRYCLSDNPGDDVVWEGGAEKRLSGSGGLQEIVGG